MQLMKPQPNGEENAIVPEIPEQKAEISGVPQKDAESDSKTVYTTTYYIGLELKPLEPGAARSLDISLDSQHFKSMCTSWAGYQSEVMDLAVVHVRNFDLPEDVFQPGETRPVRPKKKVIRKADGTGQGQKRRLEQQLDVSAPKKPRVTTSAQPRNSKPNSSAPRNQHTGYRPARNN